MKKVLLLLICGIVIGNGHAHADWFNHFCTRFLVADDPWPYGQESAFEIIALYKKTHDPNALKELDYRMRHGLLNERELQELWQAQGVAHE